MSSNPTTSHREREIFDSHHQSKELGRIGSANAIQVGVCKAKKFMPKINKKVVISLIGIALSIIQLSEQPRLRYFLFVWYTLRN